MRLLLLEAARHAWEQGRRQVEYLVSQALQFVFGGDVEFKVEVEEKRIVRRQSSMFALPTAVTTGWKLPRTPEEAVSSM